MSEIGDFINTWGNLLRNLILLAGVLGGFFRLLKTLDGINENIERIPEMRQKLEDLQSKIENLLGVQKTMQDETTTMRTDLQILRNDLQTHCANGIKKDRLTLDMSRQMLLNEIEAAIHMGWASINKKTVLSELYDSYVADGGNGTIKALWSTYLALPTEPPDNTKVE